MSERTCPNPRCHKPLPHALPIVQLYEGSAGYGYLLTCCGIVCTTEYLRDVVGLDLPDPDDSGMVRWDRLRDRR